MYFSNLKRRLQLLSAQKYLLPSISPPASDLTILTNVILEQTPALISHDSSSTEASILDRCLVFDPALQGKDSRKRHKATMGISAKFQA